MAAVTLWIDSVQYTGKLFNNLLTGTIKRKSPTQRDTRVWDIFQYLPSLAGDLTEHSNQYLV